MRTSAGWLRARGKERREAIWFRDADVAEAIDAELLGGLAGWYPPNYDGGACGYATCAEFLHATKALRDESAELEFAGPTCNLRDIDRGIGSAAKTAAIHSIDCRCQSFCHAEERPATPPPPRDGRPWSRWPRLHALPNTIAVFWLPFVPSLRGADVGNRGRAR